MKLAANPLTAKALELVPVRGQAARPSELDFGPLFAAAMEKRDPALLAQLVNITLLQSGYRLADPAPVTGQAGLMAALPALPAPASAPIAQARPAPAPAPAVAQAEPEPAPQPSAKTASLPTGRRQYDGLIQQAAARHGVDPDLVRAVVTAESDYDPKSHSSAGAMGLMQLMPETAKDMGVSNPWDPAQNIEGGTRYLAWLLRRFDGDEKKALAAYNWGPGNLERGGRMPEETRNYLKKVTRFKDMHAKGFSRSA